MAEYPNNMGTPQYCRWCGAPLYGPFCNKCGRPAGYPSAQLYSPGPPNVGQAPPWRTPKHSMGGLIALITAGVLALVLFVAVPLGVVVHNMLRVRASDTFSQDYYGDYDYYDDYGDYNDDYDAYGDYYDDYGDYGDYYDYYDDYGEYGGDYFDFYDDYEDFYSDPLTETSATRLTVLSTMRAESVPELSSDSTFYTVEVELINIASDAIRYSATDFEIAFTDGNLISPIPGSAGDDASVLGEGRLLPGGHVTGTLTFAVPTSAYSLTLFYSDPNDGGTILIPLV